MKTLEIELTDALAAMVDELVEEGWFANEAQVVRLALAEYLRRRPPTRARSCTKTCFPSFACP